MSEHEVLKGVWGQTPEDWVHGGEEIRMYPVHIWWRTAWRQATQKVFLERSVWQHFEEWTRDKWDWWESARWLIHSAKVRWSIHQELIWNITDQKKNGLNMASRAHKLGRITKCGQVYKLNKYTSRGIYKITLVLGRLNYSSWRGHERLSDLGAKSSSVEARNAWDTVNIPLSVTIKPWVPCARHTTSS